MTDITYGDISLPRIKSIVYYIDKQLMKVVTSEVEGIIINNKGITVLLYSYKLYNYYQSYLNDFLVYPDTIGKKLKLETEAEVETSNGIQFISYSSLGNSNIHKRHVYLTDIFNKAVRLKSNISLDLLDIYLNLEEAQKELIDLLEKELDISSQLLLNKYH